MFYVHVIFSRLNRQSINPRCIMFFCLEDGEEVFSLAHESDNAIHCEILKDNHFNLFYILSPKEIALSKYINHEKLSDFFIKPPPTEKSKKLYKIKKDEFLKFINRLNDKCELKLDNRILYFI